MKSFKVSGALIYLLVLALALLLYMNYAFRPLSAAVSELDAEHEADTVQLQTYRDTLANIGTLRNTVSGLESQIADLKADPPLSGSDLSQDLRDGLKAAGIAPESVKVGSATAAPKATVNSDGLVLQNVPVSIRAKCSGQSLEKLLHYYEQESKGAYYVNSVTVTQDEENASLLQADIKLTLSCYDVPPEEG